MDKTIVELHKLFETKLNSNIGHIELLLEDLLNNKKKNKKIVMRIITNNKGFEIYHVYQIDNFEEYEKIIGVAKKNDIIVKKVLNNELPLKDIDIHNDKSFKIVCATTTILEDLPEYFELTAKIS